MQEIWKPILGYEGLYEISDTGNVKSVRTGLIRKPWLHEYLRLNLSKNGQCKHVFIHRMAALSFLGQPMGREVNHIDGNKLNNTLANLEYVTRHENIKHGFKIGLFNSQGSRNNHSTLNEEKVLEIRHLKKENPRITNTEIGEMYGVKRSAISSIINRTRWRNI